MDNFAWHERFCVQAEWTKSLRQYLYQQVEINEKSRILEVGCGTGAITSEMKQYSQIPTCGIDIQFERVEIAKKQDKSGNYECADVYQLPFTPNSFDFVIAHYLLLWLKQPVLALSETLRVLKPGGCLVALAEPDYLARIDNPQELWPLGEMQTNALIQQGANPMAGRLLSTHLRQAGFIDIQYGISGFQSGADVTPAWFDSEWKTLEDDLASQATEQELEEMRTRDLKAYQEGIRIRWVPTFYA
ncbi:methyltransferase domain-containing protein, partial [bacterium]|nr:methyltransferase domain-containing protein [bacterium]